jgi:hypothetical protein
MTPTFEADVQTFLWINEKQSLSIQAFQKTVLFKISSNQY